MQLVLQVYLSGGSNVEKERIRLDDAMVYHIIILHAHLFRIITWNAEKYNLKSVF